MGQRHKNSFTANCHCTFLAICLAFFARYSLSSGAFSIQSVADNQDAGDKANEDHQVGGMFAQERNSSGKEEGQYDARRANHGTLDEPTHKQLNPSNSKHAACFLVKLGNCGNSRFDRNMDTPVGAFRRPKTNLAISRGLVGSAAPTRPGACTHSASALPVLSPTTDLSGTLGIAQTPPPPSPRSP